MNAGNQPLIVMQLDCNSAVKQMTAALRSAGYLVVQSFDLHSAMTAHSGCNCNPDSCACQMVVLLVYAQDGPPVTLICDSNEFQTGVYLVKSSQQSPPPGWIGKLAQLIPTIISSNQMTSWVE
jgi:hypothetical protein